MAEVCPSAAYKCLLCSKPLPYACKRRLLSPVTEANADVHEFFVTHVSPGFQFGEQQSYVCRQGCWGDLEKAVKHFVQLRDLLGKLKLRQTPSTSASSPSGSGATQTITSSQLGQHPTSGQERSCPTGIQKNLQLGLRPVYCQGMLNGYRLDTNI